jgi:hypothetical protein
VRRGLPGARAEGDQRSGGGFLIPAPVRHHFRRGRFSRTSNTRDAPTPPLKTTYRCVRADVGCSNTPDDPRSLVHAVQYQPKSARLGGAVFLLVALYLAYTIHDSVNNLYSDDWTIVTFINAALHHHLTLDQLWTTQNGRGGGENRVLFPYLVIVSSGIVASRPTLSRAVDLRDSELLTRGSCSLCAISAPNIAP